MSFIMGPLINACNSSLNCICFIRFDTNKDDLISKEDIRLILSYVPLDTKGVKNDYQLFLQVQSEIIAMLDDYFKGNDFITSKDLRNITMTSSSDLFFTMFMYIKANLPTHDELSFHTSSSLSIEEIEEVEKVSCIKHLLHLQPNECVLDAVKQVKDNLMDIPDENNTLCTQTQSIPDFNSSPNSLHNICETSPKMKKPNLIAVSASPNSPQKQYEMIGINKNPECHEAKGTLFIYDSIFGELYKGDAMLKSKTLCISITSRKPIYIPLQLYFVETANMVLINKIPLYPLLLLSEDGKTIKFYADSQKEQTNWVNSINKSMSRSNLLDKYEIIKIIGVGGYGVVRKVKLIGKDLFFAIKTINKAKITHPEMLRKEVQILKMCKHPNIVKLYEVIETSKEISLVMEYLSGGNLGKCMTNYLSESKIRQILDSLSSALFYIKEFGIIHRDIKLQNILYESNDPNSEVKFVDFGLSAIKDPKETSREFLGTLLYVAPEILLHQPYNSAVDVWSLGVVFYAMLFQRLPFYNKENDRVVKWIVEEQPSYPSNCLRSEDAVVLCKRMLIKDPKARISMENVLKQCFITQEDKFAKDSLRGNVKDKLMQFKVFSSSVRDLKKESNTPKKQLDA